MTARRQDEQGWLTAKTLSEALPFIQRYEGRRVVIKFGGHAMGDDELFKQFANDVVLLKHLGLQPVVIHGGGPQIGRMLDRLNIKSEFVDGVRVSDAPVVEVAEMVLSGSINKSIVTAINEAGGRAVGLSGKDARLITAKKITGKAKDPDSLTEKALDLGFVGHPEKIDTKLIEALTAAEGGFIPVISPIAAGEDGETYNINADTAAGAIAAKLKAARLLLLTDVTGVKNAEGELITQVSLEEAQRLIDDGVAKGGMIPKLETSMDAVRGGVDAVVILDGRRAHGLLVELFTDTGAGTLIA